MRHLAAPVLLAVLLVAPAASAVYEVTPSVPGHYTVDRVAAPQIDDAIAEGPPQGPGVRALVTLAACRDHGIVGNDTMLDRARTAFDGDAFASAGIADRARAVHAALCLAEETGTSRFVDVARDLAGGLTEATSPTEAGVAGSALFALGNATGNASRTDDAVALLDEAADRWYDGEGFRSDTRYRLTPNAWMTVANARAVEETNATRFRNRTRTVGDMIATNLSRAGFPTYLGGNETGPTTAHRQYLGYMAGVAYGETLGNESVVNRVRIGIRVSVFILGHFDMDRGVFLDERGGNVSHHAAALALVSHANDVGYRISSTDETADLTVRERGDGVDARGAWNRTVQGEVRLDRSVSDQLLFDRASKIGGVPNPLLTRGRSPIRPPSLTGPTGTPQHNVYLGSASGEFFVALMNLSAPSTPYRFHQMLPVVVNNATTEGEEIVLEGRAAQPAEPRRLTIDLDAPNRTAPTRVTFDGEDLPISVSASNGTLEIEDPPRFDGPFTIRIHTPASDGGFSLEATPEVIAGISMAAAAIILLMVYAVSLRRSR